MHVTRQAFITSCSNIILTYLLIYSVVDLGPSLAARLGLVGVLTPPRKCPTRVDGVGKMYPGMGGGKFVPSPHAR